MAALVIETGAGLGADEVALAAELGPSDVRSAGSLEELSREVGLRVDEVADVTEAFHAALGALWEGLRRDESELRRAEGDVEYDYEVGRRRSMMEAVRRGLIRRTLVVATKP